MSEFLLRETGRLARVGGWEVSLPDLKTSWTKEALAIRELDAEGLSFNSAINSYAPEYRDMVLSHFNKCAATGEPFELQVQMFTYKERKIWIQLKGEAVKDQNGDIGAIRGVIQDINDSKKKELAVHQALLQVTKTRSEIKKKEELFKTLVEQGSDVFALLSSEGNFIYSSGNNKRVIGYEVEELLGRNAFELIHPDDISKVTTLWSVVLKSKEAQTTLFRYKTGMGNYIWMETVATNHLGNPAIAAIALSSRDVSERVHSNLLLQRSTKQFKTLFENNQDLVYFQDPKGNILDINPAVTSLYGVPKEAVLNRHISEFSVPEFSEKAHRSFSEAVAGTPNNFEGQMRLPNGKQVDLDIKRIPVVVDDQVLGVYSIAKDVTQQKRFVETIQKQAEALIEMNQQLQGQAEELHAQSESLQLLNAELTQQKEQESRARVKAVEAMEAAERATRAKSVFLATMSHEIRTPMNGVIGMSSLLQQTKLDTEQKEYAEVIRSSSEALLSIINDVLDFSKIESGEMELEQIDFDLRRCIEEVMDLLAGKAHSQGLDLLYQVDHRIPKMLLGDPLKLRQVLINLVNNALKFTRKGEVFVKVNIGQVEDDRVHLAFEVQDTGIGIPKDKLERLFKAFSQVDSSTTREYGGTGLGLVISQRLVGLMGGNISVESEYSRGSSFRFNIVAKLAQSKGILLDTTSPLKGKRVLICDDAAGRLNTIQYQLNHWGVENVVASSLEVAAHLLKDQSKFHWLLIDHSMMKKAESPCIRLKEISNHCPVILMSSGGEVLDEELGKAVNAYLSKPLKPCALYQLLLQVVEEKKDAAIRELEPENYTLDQTFAARNPLNILLAEDNLINQKLAVRVLNKLGYHPGVANNGLEVLELIEGTQYDLILMDLLMPQMDGLEATRRIREQNGAQPRIVAMTANAFAEDKNSCIEAGMDGYLSKPFKLEDFVAILLQISAGRSQIGSY
nr:PAS domain S-box protein [Pedobacter sp. SYSU D00535]